MDAIRIARAATGRDDVLKIFGSYGDAWLTENYLVPVGYVLAVATAGANSPRS